MYILIYKELIKKIIGRNKRLINLYKIYKEKGWRGASLELSIFLLIKLRIDVEGKSLRRQALYLYAKSKHLRRIEKILISRKAKHTVFNYSVGKKLLQKGILPIEEI